MADCRLAELMYEGVCDMRLNFSAYEFESLDVDASIIDLKFLINAISYSNRVVFICQMTFHEWNGISLAPLHALQMLSCSIALGLALQ